MFRQLAGGRNFSGSLASDSSAIIVNEAFVKKMGFTDAASPLGWFAMNQWLQDFAYRINIGASVFLVAGIMALVIAAITISFQTIRAALANPVKSLRTE